MKLLNLPLSNLKNMESEGVKELQYYTHKNPLVRWIFWKRLQTMASLADDSRGKALDFGAGSGLFSISLSRYFDKVYSLDMNTKSLYYVKEKYNLNNVEVVKSKGSKLPYPGEFFDIIFVADVLEHFKDSLDIQKEFNRVLRGGGSLIVSGPTENLFYNLARKTLFWRKKPYDHYSNIDKIMKRSSELFDIEEIKVLPSPVIPGFKVYRARKNG